LNIFVNSNVKWTSTKSTVTEHKHIPFFSATQCIHVYSFLFLHNLYKINRARGKNISNNTEKADLRL